jgi:DMSO reductase anchor subunit
VQACPNSAIRVTTIRRQEVVDNCETGVFLPGAPDPRQTRPATHYRTKRVFPRNVLPADYFSVRPEHAHWPLIVMLVLTQLSVGAFVVELLLDSFVPQLTLDLVRGVQAAGALAMGLMALGASTLHLGRPLYAFRAIVGLRTSWLSREIVAFGLFAGLAIIYAGLSWTGFEALSAWRAPLGIAVVVTGLAGVACSILIYQCTGRELWSGARTSWRFLLTGVVLGISATLLLSLIGSACSSSLTITDVMRDYGRALAGALLLSAGTKLLGEALIFVHLRDRLHTPLKRSALLLTGDIARFTFCRFLLGAMGGLLLPWWLVSDAATAEGTTGWPALLIAGASFGCLLAGELLERYLFFTAVATPRMPGGLRA